MTGNYIFGWTIPLMTVSFSACVSGVRAPKKSTMYSFKSRSWSHFYRPRSKMVISHTPTCRFTYSHGLADVGSSCLSWLYDTFLEDIRNYINSVSSKAPSFTTFSFNPDISTANSQYGGFSFKHWHSLSFLH